MKPTYPSAYHRLHALLHGIVCLLFVCVGTLVAVSTVQTDSISIALMLAVPLWACAVSAVYHGECAVHHTGCRPGILDRGVSL